MNPFFFPLKSKAHQYKKQVEQETHRKHRVVCTTCVLDGVKKIGYMVQLAT